MADSDVDLMETPPDAQEGYEVEQRRDSYNLNSNLNNSKELNYEMEPSNPSQHAPRPNDKHLSLNELEQIILYYQQLFAQRQQEEFLQNALQAPEAAIPQPPPAEDTFLANDASRLDPAPELPFEPLLPNPAQPEAAPQDDHSDTELSPDNSLSERENAENDNIMIEEDDSGDENIEEDPQREHDCYGHQEMEFPMDVDTSVDHLDRLPEILQQVDAHLCYASSLEGNAAKLKYIEERSVLTVDHSCFPHVPCTIQLDVRLDGDCMWSVKTPQRGIIFRNVPYYQALRLYMVKLLFKCNTASIKPLMSDILLNPHFWTLYYPVFWEHEKMLVSNSVPTLTEILRTWRWIHTSRGQGYPKMFLWMANYPSLDDPDHNVAVQRAPTSGHVGGIPDCSWKTWDRAYMNNARADISESGDDEDQERTARKRAFQGESTLTKPVLSSQSSTDNFHVVSRRERAPLAPAEDYNEENEDPHEHAPPLKIRKLKEENELSHVAQKQASSPHMSFEPMSVQL